MQKKITLRFNGTEVTRTLDVCTVEDVLKAPQIATDPDLQFGDNTIIRSQGVTLSKSSPVSDGQVLNVERHAHEKG